MFLFLLFNTIISNIDLSFHTRVDAEQFGLSEIQIYGSFNKKPIGGCYDAISYNWWLQGTLV